ncbi:MAG TPA: hypothetical protein VKF59_14260 [Candidatus Dormibacteraeota bacterium]|nr:hypothetical protein [Candidatus Dormibacteraeota bacterium]
MSFAGQRCRTGDGLRLPQARMEMLPGAGPLALVPAWKRALSHLTPKR